MTYRAIILVPEGLTFEQLTEEQQAACNSVFGQYVNPMPGSVPSEGFQLVDALTNDKFDPAVMLDFGLNWPVLSLTQWDGNAEKVEIIIPLNQEAYVKHMPDGILTETHRWAGWPSNYL